MVFDGLEVAPVYYRGLKTKYVVSKDGRVFNAVYDREIKRKIDTKGYYKVSISLGSYVKDARVHVLVAQAFVPNPDPERFRIVNHLDGNKLNPVYTNLEWTDHSGNVRHALRTGLTPIIKGEDRVNAQLTNEQVHRICQIMEDGTSTQREIARMFNVEEYIIHEIKLGHNWKWISCNYNIENCKVDNRPLNKETVINICKDLEANELNVHEIADKYNIKYGRVLEILNGRNFKKITSKFDFSNFTRNKPRK